MENVKNVKELLYRKEIMILNSNRTIIDIKNFIKTGEMFNICQICSENFNLRVKLLCDSFSNKSKRLDISLFNRKLFKISTPKLICDTRVLNYSTLVNEN